MSPIAFHRDPRVECAAGLVRRRESLEGTARVFQGSDPTAEPFAGAACPLVTVTGSEHTCRPAAATDTVLVGR